MNGTSALTATLFVLLISVLCPRLACSCGETLPRGAEAQVLAECAVVVWDPARQHEDFIRRADFTTNAPNFGFLVPTPTPPALTANDGSAFADLDARTFPQTITVDHGGVHLCSWIWLYFTQSTAGEKLKSDKSAHVQVLSTRMVGGYQATVLRAADAPALAAWLRGHGYSSRPALEDWLRPYVSRHWVITAFKIIPSRSGTASTGTVRMSFDTDRPFFPYREPSDQRANGASSDRSLGLFVLAPMRVAGQIGAGDGPWPGHLLFADRLPGMSRNEVARHLGMAAGELPQNMILSVFEDKSSPRPGTDDLFFTPSWDQASVKPPIRHHDAENGIWIPVELLPPALYLLIRRLRWLRQMRNRARLTDG